MAQAVPWETAPFHPFEYMAWAKQVAPGALYPMHVSGLPGPDPSLELPALRAEEWIGPVAPVRARFAKRLTEVLGAPGRAIVPAGGASEAIFLALAPFVARGQRVVVEQPAYRAMERVVGFRGGVPVRLERRAADGWRLDPKRLDALLTATGARLVGITDPHNPTGVSLDPATRSAVIEVVERRRALLVVDEIFAAFRGVARPAAWAAQSESVLSVGSLTKGWGLASLRTGWVLGRPDLVERCSQVFDLLGVNPPPGTLALALRFMDVAARLDAYAHAASLRVNEVFAATDWGASRMVPPHDGIIGFLRLPAGWRSEAATAALRRCDGVQVVPGRFFGCDDHLRIGFAGDAMDPVEGCRLISARLNAGPAVGAIAS